MLTVTLPKVCFAYLRPQSNDSTGLIEECMYNLLPYSISLRELEDVMREHSVDGKPPIVKIVKYICDSQTTLKLMM